MKLIVAMCLLPLFGFGQADETISTQTENLLVRFLRTEKTDITPSTQRVTKFLDRLATHPESYRSQQQQFVRQLFVKTHSRFLKTFRDDAVFSQIFSNGNYNCLTATALLAVALQRFNYTFKIYETNHHIFILVETDRGSALLESTDPIAGFITDSKTIVSKIERYKTINASETDSRVIQYQFKTKLFKEVSLDEVAGLLHFNLAAKSYNNKRYEDAIVHLEAAGVLYQSSRIQEFLDVILITLRETSLKNASLLSARVRKLKALTGSTSIDTKF
jgi:hypothetical protein